MKERRHLAVDSELKRILMLFLLYLAVFTILSVDQSRSLKGSYDMLRGLVQFPIAVLLAHYARDESVPWLLKLVVAVTIAAQFLFPQQEFFGFYVNPNNIAVMLVFLISLSLLSWSGANKRVALNALAASALLLGLYLLVLSNSRAAWLGCAVGAGGVVMCTRWLSVRQKAGLLVGVGAILLAALSFLNWKGMSLNLRDVIWETLFRETMNSRPMLGYGINYTKDLMPMLDLPHLTAHNLFLEIFISSGIVGIVFLIFLAIRLLRHYWQFQYRNDALFYPGIFGLCAFLVMGQFDLKFASYRFFGSHCFFLGLVYAHRSRGSDKAAPMAQALSR